MRKKTKLMVICLFFILCLFSFSFAQQEQITITTYYPSPYGSYREMRAQRMAIGDDYIKGDQYCWSPETCITTIDANADLVVQGNVGIGTSNPNHRLHILSSLLTPANNDRTIGIEQGVASGPVANNSPGIEFLNPGATTPLGGIMLCGWTGAWTSQSSPNDVVVSSWMGNLLLASGIVSGIPQTRVFIRGSDGYVGIGTTGPGQLLTVQGEIATDAGNVKGLYVRGNGGSTSCPIYFNDEFGYPQKSIYQEGYYMKIRGHNNEGVWILGSNASSAPSVNYKFNGTNNGSTCYNASNSANWNTTSDERIKENVKDLGNALDKIKQLRPVTFDYTEEYAEHRSWKSYDKEGNFLGWNGRKNNNIGWIAQGYKNVFPNDVSISEEIVGNTTYKDFHTLQPDSVVPYLVKAVQELSAKNDALEARLLALENAQ